MLTTPITTSHFRTRIQELISDHLSENHSFPAVPALTDLDTDLAPGEFTAHLLAFTSPWIDVCSPDPLMADISKQILFMEVAYAAFCGIEYVFIEGPVLHHQDVLTQGITQYARAIRECLSIGSHLQISIVLPMCYDPAGDSKVYDDLAPRDQYLDDAEEQRSEKIDYFGTWDAWNTTRSVCSYNSRLFVGKNQIIFLFPRPRCLRSPQCSLLGDNFC